MPREGATGASVRLGETARPGDVPGERGRAWWWSRERVLRKINRGKVRKALRWASSRLGCSFRSLLLLTMFPSRARCPFYFAFIFLFFLSSRLASGDASLYSGLLFFHVSDNLVLLPSYFAGATFFSSLGSSISFLLGRIANAWGEEMISCCPLFRLPSLNFLFLSFLPRRRRFSTFFVT